MFCCTFAVQTVEHTANPTKYNRLQHRNISSTTTLEEPQRNIESPQWTPPIVDRISSPPVHPTVPHHYPQHCRNPPDRCGH